MNVIMHNIISVFARVRDDDMARQMRPPHADDAIWMAFLASIAQPKLVPFLAHWHRRCCGNNNQKQDMAWW